MRRLTCEIDNIHAAWTWAIGHEKFDLLGQTGRAFGWYFEIAGLYREGIEQLELLVQVLRTGENSDRYQRVLGLALLHLALLNFRKGHFEQAWVLYEDSICTLRPTNDQALLADALTFLGTIQHLMGEYTQATSLLEEGLVFARASNELWFEAFAIYVLGHVASLMGRYSEGYDQMLEGLAIWRSLGDPQAISLGLNFLVSTVIQLGHYEEAKNMMYESIALCEQSKNRWGLGTGYRFLGMACIAGGQFTEAQNHLLKSLEIFGQFAQGWDIAQSLTYLGEATMLAGEMSEAKRIYQQAVHIAIESKATPIALDALAGICKLRAADGKTDQALILCHYILNHPSGVEETKAHMEKLRVDLESRLNPEQVRAARAMAQQITFGTVINEVTETTRGGSYQSHL